MKDIVVSGYAGAVGVREIIKRYREDLSKIYRPTYMSCMYRAYDEYSKPEDAYAYDDCEVYKSDKGGVLKTLYEIAVLHKSGIRISIKRIPILQSTIEICERYEINPYRLLCDCQVIVTDHGDWLVDNLISKRIPSAVIGVMTSGLDKVITDKEEIEYLNRPEPDEIIKAIPDYKDIH